MKDLFERYIEVGADNMEASNLEDMAEIFGVIPADLRVALAAYRYLRNTTAVTA